MSTSEVQKGTGWGMGLAGQWQTPEQPHSNEDAKPNLGYAEPVAPQSAAQVAAKKSALRRKMAVSALVAAVTASMIGAGLVLLILL